VHVKLCLEDCGVFFWGEQSTTTSFSNCCDVNVTESFAIVTKISTAELALLNRPSNKQRSHTVLHFLEYHIFNPNFLNACLWPRNEETWFLSQVSKYWIFGKPIWIPTGFTARSLVFPLSVFYHSTVVSYSFWYKHHRQYIL